MRFHVITLAAVAASCIAATALGQSRTGVRSHRGRTVRVASYEQPGAISYDAGGAPCDCGAEVGPVGDCCGTCSAPKRCCCWPGLIPLTLDCVGKTMHGALVCLDKCLLGSGHRCCDPCGKTCGDPSLRYPLYDCDCDVCRAGGVHPDGAVWETEGTITEPAPIPQEAPIEELDAPPPPAAEGASSLNAPRVLEQTTSVRRLSPPGRSAAERSVVVSRSHASTEVREKDAPTRVVRRTSGAGSVEFRIPHNPLRD